MVVVEEEEDVVGGFGGNVEVLESIKQVDESTYIENLSFEFASMFAADCQYRLRRSETLGK